MTSNKDMPAMPMFSSEAKPCMVRDVNGDKNDAVAASGLTKLEHFAGLAMQGLLAGGYCIDDPQNRLEDVSSEAIVIAEALLAQLEEKDCE
jgi:hypothetical protein